MFRVCHESPQADRQHCQPLSPFYEDWAGTTSACDGRMVMISGAGIDLMLVEQPLKIRRQGEWT